MSSETPDFSYLVGGKVIVQCIVDQVRVFNLSASSVRLKRRVVLGVLSAVTDVTPLPEAPSGVQVSVTCGQLLVTLGTPSGGDIASSNGEINPITTWLEPFTVPEDFTDYQKIKLLHILSKCTHVFAQGSNYVGHTLTIKYRIQTIDEVPLKQPYRPIPPAQIKEVRQHLTELLHNGIISESRSFYATPIMLVRKKDGRLRMCCDYCQLNKKTVRYAYPLPRIEDSLGKLHGAQYFSCVDLKSAYNQVDIDERNRYKSAFSTPFGLFEYKFMPFWLCNSPATFQRLMQTIFRDQLYISCWFS